MEKLKEQASLERVAGVVKTSPETAKAAEQTTPIVEAMKAVLYEPFDNPSARVALNAYRLLYRMLKRDLPQLAAQLILWEAFWDSWCYCVHRRWCSLRDSNS